MRIIVFWRRVERDGQREGRSVQAERRTLAAAARRGQAGMVSGRAG